MTAPTATNAAPAKSRGRFTPAFASRPSPDQARRQGTVASRAWQAFGGRDEVMAFLNTHHVALDARPLDAAIESDEGLHRVLALLTLSAKELA